MITRNRTVGRIIDDEMGDAMHFFVGVGSLIREDWEDTILLRTFVFPGRDCCLFGLVVYFIPCVPQCIYRSSMA